MGLLKMAMRLKKIQVAKAVETQTLLLENTIQNMIVHDKLDREDTIVQSVKDTVITQTKQEIIT